MPSHLSLVQLLASASVAPTSDSNVELVLSSAAVVVVVGLLAFLPIHLARAHRQRDAIAALVVLCGLISAGSISYFIMLQMDWSSTYTQRIETGYYDPQDTSDKPQPPFALWCGLAGSYAGLTIWASRKSQ